MTAAPVQMDAVLRVVVALVPVLLFLAGLRLLDSFKLVPRQTVAGAILAGAVAAAVCYLINTFFLQHFPQYQSWYPRFAAPIVEELMKSVFWIFLIATSRVAFMVDSAICGFAIGTGFALFENVFFLEVMDRQNLTLWILRGFGTAVMHGGAAALGALIAVYLFESRQWRGIARFAPGLAVAILLHSLFNQGLFSPLASTAAVVLGLPSIFLVVFWLSEQSLRHWLAGKLDQDIDTLAMIASGDFKSTRQGAYLMSLHEAFPPEIRGDMLTLLHLTIELSARAKGDLLLREAGLEIRPDPEMESRLKELKYLERSIGRTGMLALRPLLRQTPRDLWEMHRLTN